MSTSPRNGRASSSLASPRTAGGGVAAGGANHPPAGRVPRRRAGRGCVAARGGRGPLVGAPPPVEGGTDDEAWQLSALPPRPGTYAEQMLAEALGTGRDAI